MYTLHFVSLHQWIFLLTATLSFWCFLSGDVMICFNSDIISIANSLRGQQAKNLDSFAANYNDLNKQIHRQI